MEENKLERKYGLFTAICMVVGIVIGLDPRRPDPDLLHPCLCVHGAEV